jgi:2-polyprenyl-3-methyl-5-hydroxy-6-metoxy-1,4-benzoquinol methylase
MKSFWEQRYGQKEYAYGTEPNQYFKEALDTLTPGKILMAAEGEGRNAVYAATQGWEVVAYDWSENAQRKAHKLASEYGVQIEYHLASLNELHFQEHTFDALALIYVHFPEQIRLQNHQKLYQWLKPGGHLIIEAFSKSHLSFSKKNPAVGGPKELSQLYSLDVGKDFQNRSIIKFTEDKIQLNEGIYHQGQAQVIRLFASKHL